MPDLFYEPKFLIPAIYIALISIISFFVCCYDKFAAKHIQKHRTRESTLLWLSALGGSVAMLLCMLLIRHKTKHKKFMIGIPLIIILQAALCVAAVILL